MPDLANPVWPLEKKLVAPVVDTCVWQHLIMVLCMQSSGFTFPFTRCLLQRLLQMPCYQVALCMLHVDKTATEGMGRLCICNDRFVLQQEYVMESYSKKFR